MKALSFAIKSEASLSTKIRQLGIHQWSDLVSFVQQIPYGRTSNRNDLGLVIDENRGTCSSKHALIKKLATENGQHELKLVIGLYKMNESNTPGIGGHIKEHGLEYIPEAHCYLKWEEERIDITSENANFEKIENDLLLEQEIEPEQIGAYKVEFHQNYLRQWIEEGNPPYTFEKIWEIREKCIWQLSQ